MEYSSRGKKGLKDADGMGENILFFFTPCSWIIQYQSRNSLRTPSLFKNFIQFARKERGDRAKNNGWESMGQFG